jgi:cytoskeletal protein CcmA (bactofilin family)
VSESQPCIIGPGASFEGKVSFAGDARIEGTTRGEVRGEGTLVIARTGLVEADVEVDRLVVEGALRGEVRAKSAVEIAAGAEVYGRVVTPQIRVEDGAFLSARVEMGESAPAA